MSALQAIAARLNALLQGEPLRVIVYGAAVVVWLVTHIALQLGYTGFGPAPDLDAILASATAIAAFLTEVCRRFVYAPSTVIDLLSVNTPQDAA